MIDPTASRHAAWCKDCDCGAALDDRHQRRLAAGGGSAASPAASAATSGAAAGPQPRVPPSARSQPRSPENPGLFNEMGKALEKSLSILPTLKSPSETLDDLNAKAKDAPRMPAKACRA